MARDTRQAEIYTCDGCGKQELGPMQGEPPIGWYVGQVSRGAAGGAFGGEWAADKLSCVRKAIAKVTEV